MKLSRAKAFTSIILTVFCLLFSYQLLIFAQQPTINIPTELQELLQGKSSDFSSAVSLLKETDLPATLAVIELLKFKALHQEIPVSVTKSIVLSLRLSPDLQILQSFRSLKPTPVAKRSKRLK